MQRKQETLYLFDRWLMLGVIATIIYGLIMIASASIVYSEQVYHWPFHFLMRQLIYLILGVVMLGIITKVKVSTWEDLSFKLLFLVIILLIAVLIPHIGHRVNGSARWVGFGPLKLQVSEFVKFAMIVFVSGYLVRRNEEVRTKVSGFIKPMILVGVVAFLLLLEPDFGAVVVMTAAVMGMMFMAGVPARNFIVLMLVVGVLFALLVVAAPYRLERLTTFMNPWAHPFSQGYQLTQSLIAFGRGGVFGVGLGNSVQKLFYLPEAHTDFIFAVLFEELGLVGALVVVGLFVLIVWRILLIAKRAQEVDQHFAAYIAYGVAIWLGMQFMVNIGVNAGILPTKGLTLPFMSYGGSSMLVDCIAISLIFRIDYETRAIKFGRQHRPLY